MKVLIGPSSFASLDKAPMEKLVQAGYEVVNNPFGRKLTKEELLALLPGVTALIAGLEPLDREVQGKSDLKVISRCGSGMSNVDLNSAREFGIKVCSTPDGPTTAVAELTMGALLSLLRMLPEVNNDLHNKKWTKRIGGQLKNKKAAIIGFGRIGQEVGRLLKAFGAHVTAVDPALNGTVDGVPVLNMEQALKEADIIATHSSGEGVLIGKKEFSIMKKGAFLLNAARGGIIDEKELIKALDQGKVAGAWLDTFEQEPYSGPLCDYKQVILTPHIGSYTFECRRDMENEAVENLLSALKEI